MAKLKILHTADWHLGARLHERDRTDEHQAFLDWLLGLLASKKIDILLISGDVFDTTVPRQETTRQYFQFLTRLAALGHVTTVVTGGNHDSALHLDAPRELLEQLKIHVFGGLPESLQNAVLAFPQCIICAIPFLRERDLRPYFPANPPPETLPQTLLQQAITKVYADVLALAQAHDKPVIAMGHLTAAGATLCPESEREIHIGNLTSLGPEMFAGFAYTALGHLHSYQSVAGNTNIRYSGSPLPLSFSEAGRQKRVIQLEIDQSGQLSQIAHAVPVFRALEQVKGSFDELLAELNRRAETTSTYGFLPWLEMQLTEPLTSPKQTQLLDACAKKGEILKFSAHYAKSEENHLAQHGKSLAELSPVEVFESKLDQTFTTAEDEPKKAKLRQLFVELLDNYTSQNAPN